MNKTDFLKLNLPTKDTIVNIDDLNENNIKIDKEFEKVSRGIHSNKTEIDNLKEAVGEDLEENLNSMQDMLDKKADKKGSATGVASFVLANYYSSDEIKAKADYILDEEEDASPIINKWSKYLSNKTDKENVGGIGGLIYLAEGKVKIKTPLKIYRDTVLQGVYGKTELQLEVPSGESSVYAGERPDILLPGETVIKDIVFSHRAEFNKTDLALTIINTRLDGVWFGHSGIVVGDNILKASITNSSMINSTVFNGEIYFGDSYATIVSNNTFGRGVRNEVEIYFEEEYNGVFITNILMSGAKVIDKSKYSFPYEYNIKRD